MASTTPSTMTPRRPATTDRPPSAPGAPPSTFSGRTCGRALSSPGFPGEGFFAGSPPPGSAWSPSPANTGEDKEKARRLRRAPPFSFQPILVAVADQAEQELEHVD